MPDRNKDENSTCNIRDDASNLSNTSERLLPDGIVAEQSTVSKFTQKPARIDLGSNDSSPCFQHREVGPRGIGRYRRCPAPNEKAAGLTRLWSGDGRNAARISIDIRSDMNPTIFLSYSLTKVADAGVVKKLLFEIRSCLTEAEWGISDPLESATNENEGIRERVASHIYIADAVFAECSMAVPNVVFEVGFARALRYPLVLFVNKDVYTRGPEQIQSYLKLMGLNPNNPLPTDFGDIEYFEYSDEIKEDTGADHFRRQLTRLMGRLEAGVLSGGSRLLRRSSVSFQKECLDSFVLFRNDHPFVRFLAGWNVQLLADLRQRGRYVFEIDSTYYQACLSTFQSLTSRSVRAIADLTDTTEAFWLSSTPDVLKTSVKERLFVVDWREFFDSTRFNQLCAFLRMQAALTQEYSVRLVLSSSVQALQSPHHFGEIGLGYHLLLMSPDVVGGYVKRERQRLLHVESNAGLYDRAVHFYTAVRERSFQIEPKWTNEQIRRAWMKNDGVGFWNPDWHEVENRSDDYFRHYDIHIRFWIPFYDQLIRQTAAIVQGEIARLMRTDQRSLEILEVGFGTGALTRPLLGWIQNLNQPFRIMSKPLPIARYTGVDRAMPMCDLLNREFRDAVRGGECTFTNGIALEGLDMAVGDGSSFSVICGSLVLHDLFSGNGTSPVEVFKGFRRFLRPNGSLIFADAFFSDANKGAQLEVWRRRMMDNGLLKEEVEVFLGSNPEMIEAVSFDKVRTYAGEAGFDFDDPGPLPAPGASWPFRVIVLRVKSDQGSKVQPFPRRVAGRLR